MRKLVAAMLAALSLPFSVFGWGGEGHILVARIAEAQLSAKVKAKVAAILGAGTTMESISSWADQVRRDRRDTEGWHYVDIPIDMPKLDMKRDCPDPKGCVIEAIAKFRAQLKDPATPPEKRKEALMFIIHFVGDMSQPLHCSDNQDKGGNDVHIAATGGGRPGNLHSVWDGAILSRMGSEDALYQELLKDALRNRKKFTKGSVEDWANDGHQVAIEVTYGKLPVKPVAGAQNAPPIALDAAYEEAAKPAIRTQLEKGGDRLAKVLNDTLK
jgi:hypothetical protein